MPDVIEVKCQCGRKVRAPKEKAGSTGKCPYCRQPITIPLEEKYDPLRTATRSPEEILSAFEDLPIEQPAAKPIPPPPSKSASSPKPPPKPTNPCPKCGKDNPKNATECQYCHRNFKAIQVVGTKSKPAKKSVLKKLILATILAFILGIIVGIAIGPEYLNLLPPKAKILRLFGKQSNNSDSNSYNIPNTPDSSSTRPNQNSTSSTVASRTIDVKPFQIYLASLDQESNRLDQKYRSLLNKYPSAVNDDVEQTLKKTQQKRQEVSDYVRNVNAKIFGSTVPIIDKSLFSDLQTSHQKIDQTLTQYEKMTTKVTRISSSIYLGRWYERLKVCLTIIEELSQQKNPPYENNSARVSVQQGLNPVALGRMQDYPSEIEEAVRLLKSAMIEPNSNIQAWIEDQLSQQKRQVQVLDKFLKNSEKFDLTIDNELSRFEVVMARINSTRQQKILENDVKIAVQTAKEIERAYRQDYEAFNSSIHSFSLFVKGQ